MTLLRELISMFDSIPARLAAWAREQALAAHRPEMVPGEPSEWPNGEQPWCMRCDVGWPCDEYVRLDPDGDES